MLIEHVIPFLNWFILQQQMLVKGFNEASLIISQAAVNEGTTLKRLKPQARGRNYSIKIRICHIIIVLKDIEFLPIDRYTI